MSKISAPAEIKKRKKNLNKLLCSICSNKHILIIENSGDDFLIKLTEEHPDGIPLSVCSGLFLCFEEKWDFAYGKYSLTYYNYSIKYYDEKLRKKRLFGYDLHPHSAIKYEHINIKQGKPFFDKLHYYNDFSQIDGVLNVRKKLFEKITFKTIKDLIHSAVISNYQKSFDSHFKSRSI